MSFTESQAGRIALPWGLSDALGIAIGISMIAWWPWPSSNTALVSMTIVTVSMAACIPSIVQRWRGGLRPTAVGWLPTGAAAGLVVWVGLSMAFSGAPWPVSFYGWSGRQDGFLVLFDVAILSAAAVSLRREEIERVFTWVLGAGAILVLEAMLQLAGWTGFRTAPIEGIWAAMGNPNFLAAMCGLLAALALARLLDDRYVPWQRYASGALLLGLIATSTLTASTQGPVTLVVAFGTVIALRLLQCQGPRRPWIAGGLAVAGVLGVALTVLGLAGSGPLARIWASESTEFRKTFWDTAWRITNALPIFGTGPDGLARYVGQFRSEQYIIEQGPDDYLDAAHNVPLQYGATTGVAGLILWLALFGTAAILVVVVAWRRDGAPWLVAGVGGLLAVYVSQSLISIDETRLKEAGWIAVGLVVALYRPDREWLVRHTPTMTSRLGAVALGAVGFLLCLPALIPVWQVPDVATEAEAARLVANPLLPSGVRLLLLTRLGEVDDLQRTWEIGRGLVELDPRAPGQAATLAELATLADDDARALSLAVTATETDPMNARAFLALALVEGRLGHDLASAQAFERAQALAQLHPIADWEEALAIHERNLQGRD